MRLVVPLLLAACVIGCNAVIGWSDLHKTPTSTKDDDNKNSSSSGDDDGTSSSSSSGSGSSASSSGQVGGPKCDVTKPFAKPVPVVGKVNTASHETAPSLTADELTMFFQRTVGVDGGAILMSSRASLDAEWGEAVELTELEQNGVDYSPTITGDGLTLYWAELTDASPRHEVLKTATRNVPSAKFSDVRVLSTISNSGTIDDSTPSISQDGTELIFTSDRQGGVRRPFHSLRVQGEFAAPTQLTELVSGTANNDDSQFALSADGLTIFFGSDRTGSLGKSDVWSAKRPTKTAAFANFTHLDTASSADIDWPTWISPDGCRLYIGLLGDGAGDIVVATRPL